MSGAMIKVNSKKLLPALLALGLIAPTAGYADKQLEAGRASTPAASEAKAAAEAAARAAAAARAKAKAQAKSATTPLAKAPLASASAAPADNSPWLYKNSDIPVDTSWTFGTLSNGLRYAVKRNSVPAGQVSIRLRVDAGALNENENELGFAHLIEHLAFRGSTYVPDGEAKRIWQRFGVTFGSDSNAQTTATQTVYKLDLPNASPDTLSESMKILSGMIRQPRISEAALNAERSIVLAEMRESSGAQRQYSDAQRKLFFQGQRLADRSTIGTPETLNAASAQGLGDFHARWYRPEKTVIVIAGDADPAIFEKLIQASFNDWKGKGPDTPAPDFGGVNKGSDQAAIFVHPTMPRSANLAYIRPWFLKPDTIAYNEQILIDLLTLQIINRRLEAAARSGANYIFAEVSQENQARTSDITLVGITPIDDKWELAIKDVRAVIADATAQAPSKADIERERLLFANALRTGVDSYPFEAASKQADDIVTAVDIRETVAAPQTVVDVFNGIGDRLTPERLLQSAQKLFSGDATRIMYSSPVAEANAQQRLAAALNAPVSANNKLRLADNSLTLKDLPALGKPGSIVSSKTHDIFPLETAILSNGARVLMYSNKAENGQIRMLVRFGKGYQAFTPKTGGLLWTGGILLGENGVGKITKTQIDQMTVGRRIGLNFDIDNDAFQFSSTTRPEDFYDQLKLIAAKLESPGWDEGPVNRAKAIAKAGYDSYEMNAGAVLERDLDYLLRNGDLRWKSATPAEIDKITPKSLRAFWQPLLAQGPIEVSLFGDFDRNQAIKALNETIGAMKPRANKPANPAALALNFPMGNKEPVRLTHKGPADQVAAVIAWPTGGGLSGISEGRKLEVLAAIFRDRLFEKFRSEQAASYSPDMGSSWPSEFNSGGYLLAYTQVKPEDVSSFYKFANEVAADLIAKPISEDELKRAVEPIKQYVERLSSGNTFWLNSFKGSSYEPARIEAVTTLYRDYSFVTAAELQVLAKKYFRNDKAWKLLVEPEAKAPAAR
jgi:zinc protease